MELSKHVYLLKWLTNLKMQLQNVKYFFDTVWILLEKSTQ